MRFNWGMAAAIVISLALWAGIVAVCLAAVSH
jgi:hypothetical protein